MASTVAITRRFAALLFICAGLTAPAMAQTSDAAYCAQLAQTAERYIGVSGTGGSRGRTPRNLWALEQCNTPNAAEAIPVLETLLRDNGFTLPRR